MKKVSFIIGSLRSDLAVRINKPLRLVITLLIQILSAFYKLLTCE
jgi:hypothetical protein